MEQVMHLPAALSPNANALAAVEKLLARPEYYHVQAENVAGAILIDCGVKAAGGWEAGRLLAEICLGGLAQVELGWNDFAGLRWPAVIVRSDHPVLACMGSQYAGWTVKKDDYFAIGSGPIRALMAREELFDTLGFYDATAKKTMLVLETSHLPTAPVIEWIAEKCGRPAGDIYILAAATGSPAGSVQIAARSVETGLHKMLELGYDIHQVSSGWGIAPIPPMCGDDFLALGRTNDAILYGSTVQYNMEDPSDLSQLAPKIPSNCSPDYGSLFRELMSRYDNKFYDIDPLLFSPAQVLLTEKSTGLTWQAGEINSELLRRSFGLREGRA